jgi:hypothetical protein
MRFAGFVLAVLGAVGCVAAPAPEANGYNVQLYFEGVPLGTETLVGDPATIVVRRIEQRPAQCTSNSGNCDPTSVMPITLVSAKCDDVCEVTPVTTSDGSVTLQAVADRAGSTTLRVRVRSVVDGAEWDDGYPLAFRDAPPARVIVPNVVVDKLPDEK